VLVLPYGREALLVELDDAARVPGVAAALAGQPGVVEVVPGARTVLIRIRPPQLAEVRAALPDVVARAAAAPPPAGEEVVLDVVYDGADLASTAAEVGLSVAELVRTHAAAPYVVAFCGFAPGFAYLRGLPARLHVPRLAGPRTRVPPGSVAVAGGFTGVYPRSSPGGWRLLGRTDAALWDADRSPPALLAPGTRVRFREAR